MDLVAKVYCMMDTAGPDGAIFIGCCNFTEVRSCDVSTILLERGYFFKTEVRLQKILRLALEYIKNSIWSIVHHSWLLGWSDSGSKVFYRPQETGPTR